MPPQRERDDPRERRPPPLAAVDEGVLRADLDPLVISRLLFGMVNSLVEWVRPDVDAAGLADSLAALAFEGLTHGASQSRQVGRASGSVRGTRR